MQIEQRSLDAFISLIRSRQPFALSRWGNGEWDSVFGRTEGTNRSGHHYFPKMGSDLKDLLLSRPSYMLGMQNLALRLYEGQIESWLEEHGLDELDWINADVFHKASAKGRLLPLVEALREAPGLAIVGPAHLRKLENFLGFQEFVEVPLPDCYLSKDRTLKQVKSIAKSLPDGSVISVSAAMPANLMIDSIVKSPTGSRLLLIDFGSLWDPYAGVKSRSYMQTMDVAVVT
jgi:hypothetical protein